MPYLYDTHEGGTAVPDAIRRRTEARLQRFAEARYAGRYRELVVRFRGQFCYLELFIDPGPAPAGWKLGSGETRQQHRERLAHTALRLGRLRYFGNPDRWSFASYNPELDDYEPAAFLSRESAGSPEEALELALRIQLAWK